MNFDFIIRNVKIIDGSTRRRFPGELAVTGDTISAVARPGSLKDSRAGREIDGRGMALAPGFIDAHSHDDRCFWDDPYNQPKLRQGVTTVVTGMCGNSPFPIPEEGSSVLDDIKKAAGGGKMYPWTARTLEEYAVQLREIRPAVNIIPVAGHRALRVSVMGFAKRRPLGEELAGMKKLLKGSLESGARGISTGLIYAQHRTRTPVRLLSWPRPPPFTAGFILPTCDPKEPGRKKPSRRQQTFLWKRKPLFISHTLNAWAGTPGVLPEGYFPSWTGKRRRELPYPGTSIHIPQAPPGLFPSFRQPLKKTV